MPKFFHDLPEAKDLFGTLASEMHLEPFLVEKDKQIQARFGFYDQLSKDIRIPDISVRLLWSVIPTFEKMIERIASFSQKF